MSEAVTLDKVYEELKLIERNMITREEMDKILETVEILSNPTTMEQIKKSEEDIKQGRIKSVKSIRDI